MKVLILAISDWAGVGNNLSESLKRVGVDSKFYSSNAGSYNHINNSITKEQAIRFSKECDIIQFMHSVIPNINIDLSNKKIVVFHGGGKFRDNPSIICDKFNHMVDCSLIQTSDLFGLGAKNEKWLLPPIDTKLIKPKYNTDKNYIIVGHFPSSSIGKGSKNIQKIINRIKNKVPKFEYLYSDKRILWRKQIDRMSKVDIYIERMSMEKTTKYGIRKTGVWGMTALEAAALGKIVVTNFFGLDNYIKEYGKCALQISNSEEEMEELLINLLSRPKSSLIKLKKKTRSWVEKYHSFESVGLKLRSIYETL